MAVTSLSQLLHDLWVGQRPGVNTDPAATLRSGLVSDLAVGDYVIGARGVVQPGSGAGGGAAASSRTLILKRRGELDMTVSWINGTTVWFTRV
jgi:hypothetical protein